MRATLPTPATPGAREGHYRPIAEHGVIGDLRSVALVGTDGTIDWYCCPRFDAPSVFGAILDDRRGGRFRIGPNEPDAIPKQLYLPDTNVLITRFLSPNGVCELVDFMPVSTVDVERHWLVRQIRCVRGSMRLRLDSMSLLPAGNAATTRIPVRSPLAFGSFRTFVKATTCDVSSPMMPTFSGFGASAPEAGPTARVSATASPR